MRVLVTGHCGFIGSHLIARLDDAIGMDKKIGTSTEDFTKLYALVAAGKPDLIVHLGANCSSQISLRDPRMDFGDNVVGTFNVCEVARELNLPVIFNSTMKVYPGEDGVIPPYGISKLVGEQYLRLYHQLYGLQYVLNRPSSVYGPRQDGSEDGGWFTWFAKAAVHNHPITLFGTGTQSRDVLYVDDMVDLLIDQIDNFDLYKNDDYDFGGGPTNEVSLNQLLDALDYHNTTIKSRLPGDVERFVNNNKKVCAVNGWRPKFGWIEGLEKTQTWLKEQHDG